MKSKPFRTFFACWLAFALAIVPPLRAAAIATDSKPDTPPAASVPAQTATASAEKDKSAPQDTTAPTAPAVASDQPAPATAAPEAAKPEAEKTADEVAKDDKSISADAGDEKAAPGTEKPAAKGKKHRHTVGYDSNHAHNSGNERVSFFEDSNLPAGQKTDAVVSIVGSSTSAGDVADAVVSVLGSSTSSGTVGDAVVSVIGNTRVTGGTVGDAAVAVLGSNFVNGHVKGDVVAVLGNVELGPDAVVDGGLVCVGGEVIRDPKAVVHGDVQNIAIGGHHFNFDGLHTWFSQCFMYARPLAFNEHLMWAWWIALAYLGFYALVALVAPAGVSKCVQTLEERPGKSILAGVLTLLLTPVAYLLLVLTLALAIGFILIPLFSMGLFFAGIFGKVVMLAWLGHRIAKLFGNGPLAKPVISVLIGGVLVLLLYTIPVVGFIVYKLIGVLGLGVVIYTLLLSFKSNRKAAADAAVVTATAAAAASAALPPPLAIEGAVATPLVPGLPPVVSASTLPRAGFWLRLCAALLDAAMVGIVFGMMHSIWYGFGGVYPFWYAVYCVGMWAIKGTTIGGIICGLKVVRVDDRPMDWGVSVVRGLSAFLSLAVAGLGFIWVAFDDDKQSWHDKVAGTTIVKVPKGTSLL